MHGYATSAALKWLSIVLKERYGHVFIIDIDGLGHLRIASPGSDFRIMIPLGSSMFARNESELPCVFWPAAAEGWHAALDKTLLAPGVAELPFPLITELENGYRINYDVLGLTYWMLTRQEEVGRTDLDEHGRFPATSAHAYKHGYLERPIVDEWLHILGQVMQRIWPGLELKQHQFSMKISHDVDAPSRYGFRSPGQLLRAMGGDVLKRGDIKGALLASWVRLNTRDALHPADPYNTFDWIMDVSERHDLQSAFYFICGGTDPHDADYEPEHPAIRYLMRHIHARGHEIGLHPSYGTYRRLDLIRAEADRLRRIAQEEGITQTEWGGRMHYLRWEQPTTLRAWADAGMSYDSTLSYADRPGFRCGTCFEYPAFDPVAQEPLPLRVRPLVAMECTVIAPRYMGLGTGDEARAKFLQLKDACRAVGGSFTLLWHNSEFTDQAKKTLYEEVLAS